MPEAPSAARGPDDVPDVDTETPSIARVYDAMLGGKDNFAADRAVMDHIVEVDPNFPRILTENRAWQHRALRWLAGVAGVDQFLDVGSGLPTMTNTHEVVQRIVPDARVVYVDNDPAVLAYGRALLEDSERTHLVAADLTEPATILTHPTVTAHLDLSRPVGLVQGLTLHHVPDDARALRVMTAYVDALAPGSYVALSHSRLLPRDGSPESETFYEDLARYRKAFPRFTPRTTEGILTLLPGLDPVEPGVVPLHEWWPLGPLLHELSPAADACVGVVARKPGGDEGRAG